MGVSLKTEKRSSHITASSFGQWVRRAEACGGTRQLKPFWQVPVKLRRPPSLPLIFMVFPDHASFSVLRETPMTFFCNYVKKLKCGHFPQEVQSLQGLLFIQFLDRKTGVDEHILSHNHIRTHVHGDLSDHAADLNLCHVVLDFYDLSRDTQTH